MDTNDEMRAAVGKAKKAPTGPARLPPARAEAKARPPLRFHGFGADPGAEPCVLDQLVDEDVGENDECSHQALNRERHHHDKT